MSQNAFKKYHNNQSSKNGYSLNQDHSESDLLLNNKKNNRTNSNLDSNSIDKKLLTNKKNHLIKNKKNQKPFPIKSFVSFFVITVIGFFIFENSEKLIIYTDENYLKTIIRNLTGNAIKALSTTNNPKLIWKAWSNQDTYFLSITDNGLGADKLKFKALYDDKEVVGIKTGLGLHLIRDLAKAIQIDITVHSTINQGTTFVLKFQKQ